MRVTFTLILALIPMTVTAEHLRDEPPDLKATISRGLSFLAKDAVAWKDEHKCASCHHAALVVWSLREAKLHGQSVDEPVLAEMTRWVAESGDGKSTQPRPASSPKALSPKAVWFALALGADPNPDEASRKSIKRFSKTLKSEQTDDGSWAAWPETRAPILGDSDESMTALATLALLPAAASGDDSARLAREKATRWLAETKTDDDPQSIAMRLVLWRRLGRPAGEWKPLVLRIKERQNADGGWSQAKELASDAWATGQALYALANAGIKPSEPEVARARAFLTRTQRADGSWPMTSRPAKPKGKGCENLIPMIGAGSAWAIMGLVCSL